MAGGGVDCANTFFRQLFLYEQRGLDDEGTINPSPSKIAEIGLLSEKNYFIFFHF